MGLCRQTIDCLDELMNTLECFHRDLHSRSIGGVPKAGSKDSVVRLAERTNEAQQDWRLVFVDRPGTYGVTDCVDELMGENVGFDRI